MNYYCPLCQRLSLNCFRINVIVLSGILVRSFSMNIYYCWIKISFNSNPESFQILADEIVNSSMTLLIRVWIYQRGNQNPYIKEQTIQWRKEKVQKEKQRSTKHIYKSKGQVTRVPLKTRVIPGVPEGSVDPASLVTTVVSI
jgi:hypothetical protein